MIEHLKMKMI